MRVSEVWADPIDLPAWAKVAVTAVLTVGVLCFAFGIVRWRMTQALGLHDASPLATIILGAHLAAISLFTLYAVPELPLIASAAMFIAFAALSLRVRAFESLRS